MSAIGLPSRCVSLLIAGILTGSCTSMTNRRENSTPSAASSARPGELVQHRWFAPCLGFCAPDEAVSSSQLPTVASQEYLPDTQGTIARTSSRNAPAYANTVSPVPDGSVLGYGFDLRSGLPKAGPCVEAEGMPETDFQFESWNAIQLATNRGELIKALDIRGSADWFSGGFAAEYSSAISSADTSISLIVQGRVSGGYLDGRARRLNSEAQALLQNGRIGDFYRRCGDRFIAGFMMGGRFDAIYTYAYHGQDEFRSLHGTGHQQIGLFVSADISTRVTDHAMSQFETLSFRLLRSGSAPDTSQYSYQQTMQDVSNWARGMQNDRAKLQRVGMVVGDYRDLSGGELLPSEDDMQIMIDRVQVAVERRLECLRASDRASAYLSLSPPEAEKARLQNIRDEAIQSASDISRWIRACYGYEPGNYASLQPCYSQVPNCVAVEWYTPCPDGAVPVSAEGRGAVCPREPARGRGEQCGVEAYRAEARAPCALVPGPTEYQNFDMSSAEVDAATLGPSPIHVGSFTCNDRERRSRADEACHSRDRDGWSFGYSGQCLNKNGDAHYNCSGQRVPLVYSRCRDESFGVEVWRECANPAFGTVEGTCRHWSFGVSCGAP